MALSNKQKNFIEYLVAHPNTPEYTCAHECNIPNSTFATWKNKPEFVDALNAAIKEKWADAQRLAVESMIKQAKEGSFNASKFILENLGYIAPTKIELEGSLHNEIEINIVGGGDE